MALTSNGVDLATLLTNQFDSMNMDESILKATGGGGGSGTSLVSSPNSTSTSPSSTIPTPPSSSLSISSVTSTTSNIPTTSMASLKDAQQNLSGTNLLSNFSGSELDGQISSISSSSGNLTDDAGEFILLPNSEYASDGTIYGIGIRDENHLSLTGLISVIRDAATPHFRVFFGAVFGEQLEELLKPVNTTPPQLVSEEHVPSPLTDLRAYIHLFHRHWQLLRRYFMHQPSVQSWAHEVRALLRTAAHRLKSDQSSISSQVEAVVKLLEALEKSPLPVALPTNSTMHARDSIRDALKQLRLDEYEINGSPTSPNGSSSPISNDSKDKLQGQTYAKLRHQMGTCSVCRHYLRGFCDRGELCGFCHDISHTPSASKRSSFSAIQSFTSNPNDTYSNKNHSNTNSIIHNINSNNSNGSIIRDRDIKNNNRVNMGMNILNNNNNHHNNNGNNVNKDTKDKNSQYGGLKGQPLAKQRHIEKTCSICRHYLRGFCDRGEDCNFCHDTSHFKDLPASVMEELLKSKNRGKVTGQALARIRHEQNICSICRHYCKGYCDLGDDCTFCHDKSHLPPSLGGVGAGPGGATGVMDSAVRNTNVLPTHHMSPPPLGMPTPIARPNTAIHPRMNSPLFSPYQPPSYPILCQFCNHRPVELLLDPCKHMCCIKCLNSWNPEACPCCGTVYDKYYTPPVV